MTLSSRGFLSFGEYSLTGCPGLWRSKCERDLSQYLAALWVIGENYVQSIRVVLTVNHYSRFPRQVIPKLLGRYWVPIHSQLCNVRLPPLFRRQFYIEWSIVPLAFRIVSEYETQKQGMIPVVLHRYSSRSFHISNSTSQSGIFRN